MMFKFTMKIKIDNSYFFMEFCYIICDLSVHIIIITSKNYIQTTQDKQIKSRLYLKKLGNITSVTFQVFHVMHSTSPFPLT